MSTKKVAKKTTKKKTPTKKPSAADKPKNSDLLRGIPAPPGRPWPEGTPVIYCLRTSDAERKARGGFQWPESGLCEAPDWKPTANCGNGLHGTPWGIGDLGLLRLADPRATWQVIEVPAAEAIDLGGKAKFPRAWVVYSGGQAGAMKLVAENRLICLADHQSSTSGYAAPSSTSGYAAPSSTSGNAAPSSTSGDNAPSSTSGYAAPSSTSGNAAPSSTSGDNAPSSTSGYAAPSSTSGDNAPSSTSGDNAPSSTSGYAAPSSTSGYAAPSSTSGDNAPAEAKGDNCAVVTCGRYGRAKAGAGGALAVAYYDATDRPRFAVGHVGEDGIEPHVWYEADPTTGKLRPWKT